MPFDAEHLAPIISPAKAPDDGLNRENVKRVRDFLAELPPERFDMRALISRGDHDLWLKGDAAFSVLNECGTAACIAGWAIYILIPGATSDLGAEGLYGLLGITPEQGVDLFEPDGFMEPGRYTIAQAVAVLDHLLATGKVDWSVAEGVS